MLGIGVDFLGLPGLVLWIKDTRLWHALLDSHSSIRIEARVCTLTIAQVQNASQDIDNCPSSKCQPGRICSDPSIVLQTYVVSPQVLPGIIIGLLFFIAAIVFAIWVSSQHTPPNYKHTGRSLRMWEMMRLPEYSILVLASSIMILHGVNDLVALS